MAKKIKALLSVVSVGMLVYLVSAASVSVAEVGSAAGEERLADVTVSLEACVVRVDVEALEESAGGGFLALGSVSADKLLGRVGGEDAEVVSGVKLLIVNGTEAEISSEGTAREKEKDQASGTGEHSDRETSVSLRAEVLVSTAGGITVAFDFKQVFSENASSAGSGDGDREEEFVQAFEVSSTVGLQAGRPRVVSARKIEDQAMFLILHAD